MTKTKLHLSDPNGKPICGTAMMDTYTTIDDRFWFRQPKNPNSMMPETRCKRCIKKLEKLESQ